MTKFFVPLLIFPVTFTAQLNAQDLMNNSPDTLQQFGRIYYSKFQEKKEFQYTLTEGYYVLIFDHKVNTHELGLTIKRKHDTPILYQRHSGYFSFEVRKHSVAYLKFAYDSSLENTGIFAQLYRVAPQIMNTPYPSFTLKDIEGNEYSDKSLPGTVTLFLLGSTKNSDFRKVFHQLETIAKGRQIRFMVISSEFPYELREFKASVPDSHVPLISSKFHVLSPWTEIMGMFNIFIADQQGLLTYKNRLNETNPHTRQVMNEAIGKKLDALL